jgi:peptide/nickel transport system substrate-binding protein
MKRITIVVSLLIALAMVLSACAPAATQAPAPQPVTEQPTAVPAAPAAPVAPVAAPTTEPVVVNYVRSETLYTSGTQWGPPSSWNPFNGGGYAMGGIGLVYETLYIYDPLADKFTPWLAAEDMKWVDDTTLEIKLREGLTWSDGSPLTAYL